jgi:HEAT repeat protein
MHEIGPNAVPILLQVLREGDKMKDENNLLLRWRRAAWSKWPGFLQKHFPKHNAWLRFALERLFPEPPSWDDSLPLRVRWALRKIGPGVIPALVPALADRNLSVRMVAIGTMGLVDADPSITVPALTRMLRDPNVEVRLATVQALDQIASRHSEAIPALVLALEDSDWGPTPRQTAYVRESAADTLGALGPKAKPAAPVLTKLLNNTNSLTRLRAALALWRIGQDTNAMPVLASALPQVADDASCATILTALGEMGPLAHPAIPQILDSITNRFWNYSNVHDAGTIALAKISPSAALELSVQLARIQAERSRLTPDTVQLELRRDLLKRAFPTNATSGK